MAIVKIQNASLVVDTPQSFLAADTSAGVSSLVVDNITGFATGQTIIIGEMGDENSEIVSINGAPSGSTLVLLTATVFAHASSTPVRLVLYNQVEFSSAPTVTGVKSVLSTVNVWADNDSTNYIDTSATTGYYFGRFKNSVSGLFSAYSAPIPVTGYDDNTLWSVKNRALVELGEVRSDLITDDFLNGAVAEGRRMADQNPATFRWSFRTKFDVIIGYMLAGQYQIAAPTDLRDRNTYKNILGVRMGQQNRPCVYQDRVRFNQNYLNVSHTTLANAVLVGATTITLTNSRDFDASGVLTVASGVLGSGVVTISYTSNNKTTGVLSGVTGVPAAGFATALDVWQRYVPGLPTAYTIDGGMLSFDSPLLTTYDGQNVHMDYYSAMSAMTADSDTFDEPFYDLYVSWLKWKIKYLKANGKIDRDGDTDFKDFVTGLGNLIAQETPGQRISFIPDIEGFLSATE